MNGAECHEKCFVGTQLCSDFMICFQLRSTPWFEDFAVHEPLHVDIIHQNLAILFIGTVACTEQEWRLRPIKDDHVVISLDPAFANA